ncbi:MAG: hypothetical protein GKS00_28135 [Alphaproteobacteria bacterium]|nr:hypothetical protein [Alphaproteobacteria bacterium]
MVEISNRDDLEAWLEGKEPAIAVAIASRAALRAIPMAATYLRESPKDHSVDIMLPTFRANSVPWFTGYWPNHGTEVRSAADAAGYVAAVGAAAAIGYAADVTADAASVKAYGIAADAAGYAASAAHAAAANATATWAEVSNDAMALEVGHSVQEIMASALWKTGTPVVVSEGWEALKADLLSLDEDWQVWTNWYDDRLRGGIHAASRELIEALELKRVLIEDEDWKKGPKHVNAIIAALEADYRAQTPAQRPAIIEVEYGADGILHRRPSRPPEARDETQEQRLRDAWIAHAAQLAALEALNPGQNAPALAGTMRLYREALGAAYEDMNVIALGVHGDSLQAHAARADDRLLEDAAGALVGMAAAHGLFVRQFDAWLDYLNDATPEPSDERVEAAADLARSARDVPELIGDDVTEPLNDLADAAMPPLAADPADRPPPAVQREFLRSLGNVLSGLYTPFVDLAHEARGEARAGMLEGVRDGTKGLTQKLIEKAPKAIAFGGLALALAVALPAEFGWLIPVIALLKLKWK